MWEMLASILIFSSQNCATRGFGEGFGEGGGFVPQLVVFRHRWLFFFLFLLAQWCCTSRTMGVGGRALWCVSVGSEEGESV